ncbi:Formyl-CoA transferase [Ancylobacter novellus DSM 506]|uniref:Formyl-CoA transferase n=1 Tax=Ancylobacter novellus (strain ATCC 8093 / DSM 506 / JCM 20403 / CCM 1077 / IAM 12100 / NBRC 12443 / NCIMB 10456) TaxID=639283 RepID=D7A2M0_ANCN5|nr:CoA transferase [Ancylobacter novellus]ADH91550.1 Formyl-CoA transferase [Ancylobacter novellus DSM 506]
MPRTIPFAPDGRGPLDGVRVVDLSRLVAGNMTTHVLADYGADVIKIERPGKGDDLRNWRVEGVEVFWKVYARNKRSVALDIHAADGREMLLRLVDTAQVLVENFVPGTLERWGLGPDQLLARNPKIVILRVSGWGQTGPWRLRPGFGTLVEAMSGWAFMNGHADKPPTLPPLAMADMVAGLYGTAAILAALRAVELGDAPGQVLDLSLFEPIHSLIGAEAAQIRLTGEPTPRAGNQSSHTAPRNVYECADGAYVALSGSMQSMAERIFDTIGRPELKTDPRFVDNAARVAHRDELDAIIAAFIAGRDQAENLLLFEAAGVTVGPVCSVADLMDHPFVEGREAIVEIPDRDLGSVPMHNIIPRFSATPAPFRRAAPEIGEHTEELRRELGMATTPQPAEVS